MRNGNILYLYESAVGLGHQRRASGIVNGLVAAEFNVIVASGSFVDAGDYFDSRASLVRLPANRRMIDDKYFYYDENNVLVHDPEHNQDKWRKQRVAAITAYAHSRCFDAVIAEWWPFNRREHFNDIIDSVLTLQNEKYGIKPLLISSVRDVPRSGYHHEDAQRILQIEHTIVELINRYVDAVLVHGDPALVRLEDGFTLHQMIQKPVIYTGYVVNAAAQTHHQVTSRRKVIVSCGSGDEGIDCLINALHGLARSVSLQEFEWHFVTGPRMDDSDRLQFMAVAKEVAVRFPDAPVPIVHTQMSELPRELAHAAFSISLGGYNTTLEVVASRVPAILIPKFTAAGCEVTSLNEEQWDRLVRLRDKGMASIAHPELVLQPDLFAQAIDEAHIKGFTSHPLDMDGAINTAVEVGRMIAQRKARITIETSQTSHMDIVSSPPTLPPAFIIDSPKRDDSNAIGVENFGGSSLG